MLREATKGEKAMKQTNAKTPVAVESCNLKNRKLYIKYKELKINLLYKLYMVGFYAHQKCTCRLILKITHAQQNVIHI